MNKGTIAAIATAPGRGGVGVIRISGSNLLPFAFALTGKSPKPRYATLADFLAAGFSEQQALEVLLGVSLATLCNFANNLAGTDINPQLKAFAPGALES